MEDVRETLARFYAANPGIQDKVHEVAESLGPLTDVERQCWARAKRRYLQSAQQQETK